MLKSLTILLRGNVSLNPYICSSQHKPLLPRFFATECYQIQPSALPTSSALQYVCVSVH